MSYANTNPEFHGYKEARVRQPSKEEIAKCSAIWSSIVNRYRFYLYRNDLLCDGLVKTSHPILAANGGLSTHLPSKDAGFEVMGMVECIWRVKVDWETIYPALVNFPVRFTNNVIPLIPKSGEYIPVTPLGSSKHLNTALLCQSEWSSGAVKASLKKVEITYNTHGVPKDLFVPFIGGLRFHEKANGRFFMYQDLQFGGNPWNENRMREFNQNINLFHALLLNNGARDLAFFEYFSRIGISHSHFPFKSEWLLKKSAPPPKKFKGFVKTMEYSGRILFQTEQVVDSVIKELEDALQ